jgi:hypothetical protein
MQTLSKVHEMTVGPPEDFLDSLADMRDEATWWDDDFSCEPLHDPLGAARRGPARSRSGERRAARSVRPGRGGWRGFGEKDS